MCHKTLFYLIAIIFLLPVFAANAAPADDKIAVLPIKILDTSGEAEDQKQQHERRLRNMAAALAADVKRAGRYDAVLLSQEDVQAACPRESPECLFDYAQKQHAKYVFIGVVHKSSTLIMQIFSKVVDVETGKTVSSRDISFRGDNDDSWSRAESFLSSRISIK